MFEWFAGLSHGREAAVQFEEALRQQRMCRELRRRTPLTDVLRAGQTVVTGLLEEFEDQNDFMAIFDPPAIMREFWLPKKLCLVSAGGIGHPPLLLGNWVLPHFGRQNVKLNFTIFKFENSKIFDPPAIMRESSVPKIMMFSVSRGNWVPPSIMGELSAPPFCVSKCKIKTLLELIF